MKKGKTLILISLSIFLIFILAIVAFSFSEANPQEKANELQFNNVVEKVSAFFKSNKDKLQIDKGDMIAEVNGIPIYKNEFELRKELTLAPGVQTDNLDDYILQKLIKEKVQEYLANKYNVKVSQNEINAYIEKEKKEFNEYPEAKKKLNELIAASGMTEDEYWNTYEKYNAKRILLFSKLNNYIIEEGIKSGKLKKAEEMTNDVQNEYKRYVDSIIDEYLKSAKISINNKYKDMFKDF
ncbi:SurA N-terminal domain-containing protein [Thermoanaerobacter thermocopriae]|uniref:SurA N-terminal domain-containing protein n=1 Tax=Thermoanaerobacter thermocopriae TaxID=29350 RepID=UPI000491C270|nr:SurA N-terminal domain-containing protein [Thermoanaerobacter thermocopriae]